MPEVKPEKTLPLHRTLLTVGALVAAAGLAYLFLSAKQYEARARLRIANWVRTIDAPPTDANLVITECDLIRSNIIEDPVIQKLKLTDAWGKRYRNGAAMSLDEARAHLNGITSIQPVAGSTVVDVNIVSDDATETAPIANALAQEYRDYRTEQHNQAIRGNAAALKEKWEAQNEKMRAAQAEVDTRYFEVMHQRSTNEIIDAGSYDLLGRKRVELSVKLINAQHQLDSLKGMDRAQLKDVLSSIDTNSLLATTMLRLSKARSNLGKMRVDHADDSQEVKDAKVDVDQLEAQVSKQVDAAMSVRETDIETLKAGLAQLDDKIKNSSTNAAPATMRDADYAKAVEKLNQLTLERDDLQRIMEKADLQRDAALPTGIMVDIVEHAEVPINPFVPDRRLAAGVVGCGGVIVLAGIVMMLMGKRTRPNFRAAPR